MVTAKEMFAPAQTAVLVIDVQTGLFSKDPAPLDAEAVIARINEVTSRARSAGAPVVIIRHDGEPGGDFLEPGTEDSKLHPKLQVEASDLRIRKTTNDAFYQTDLESALRSRRITTVLLTGYATEFCVDATLRNAVSKDFGVVVVADAHTTDDSPVLSAALIRQHHNWAWANGISPRGVKVVPASEVHFTAP
jgi:nicotinamidase-related amidase